MPALRRVGGAIQSVGKQAVPAGTFQNMGVAAGGALTGGPWGALLGGLAGNGISKIAGFGAYKVTANSLVNQVDEGVQIPEFSDGRHATIIRHREYVTDLVVPATPTAFTNLSFPLNPSVAGTFPWLAGVASNYDSYQVLGMIFEFRSTTSDITAGGALGTVIMSTDYNSVDANFANKLIMENSEYAVSNKPSLSMVHCIECDPSITTNPIKYLRSGPVPSGKDPRLYDWGNFQVATTGLPGSAGQVLGELWVSYEIALFKPCLVNSIAGGVDHFTLPASVASTHYLSADTTSVNSAAVGSTIGGTTQNSTYSFPANAPVGAKYIISYEVKGAATATAAVPVFGTLTNCSALAIFNQAGTAVSTYTGSNAGQTVSTIVCVLAVTITAPSASVTMTAGTMLTTPTGGDLLVSQLPPGQA